MAKIKVTKESDSGRNINFENTKTGEQMTRPEFVKQIKNGEHPGYHVRKVRGVETPVSNPDGNKNNNLG